MAEEKKLDLFGTSNASSGGSAPATNYTPKPDTSSGNSAAGKDTKYSGKVNYSKAASNARAAVNNAKGKAGGAYATRRNYTGFGSGIDNSGRPLTGQFSQQGTPGAARVYAGGGLNPSAWGSSVTSPSVTRDPELQKAIDSLTLSTDYADRNIHAIDPIEGEDEEHAAAREAWNMGRQMWAFNDTEGVFSREYANSEEQLADILDLMTHAQVYYKDALDNNYTFNIDGKEVSAADSWKDLYDRLDRYQGWLTDIGQVQDLFARASMGESISTENIDTMKARAQARADNPYGEDDAAMWAEIVSGLDGLWNGANRADAKKLQAQLDELQAQLDQSATDMAAASASLVWLDSPDVVSSDEDRARAEARAAEAEEKRAKLFADRQAVQDQFDQLNAVYRERNMTPRIEEAMAALSLDSFKRDKYYMDKAREELTRLDEEGRVTNAAVSFRAHEMEQQDQALLDEWNTGLGFNPQFYNNWDRFRAGLAGAFLQAGSGVVSAVNWAAKAGAGSAVAEAAKTRIGYGSGRSAFEQPREPVVINSVEEGTALAESLRTQIADLDAQKHALTHEGRAPVKGQKQFHSRTLAESRDRTKNIAELDRQLRELHEQLGEVEFQMKQMSGEPTNVFEKLKYLSVEELTAGVDEFVDTLDSKGAALIAQAKEGIGDIGKLLIDVEVNGFQMFGDQLFGPASLAMLGTRVFGNKAAELRREGYGTWKQGAGAVTDAAIEMISESIFNVFGMYGGHGITREFSERLVREWAETNVGRTLMRVALSTVGEQGEEWVAWHFAPLVDIVLGEGDWAALSPFKPRSESDYKELANSVLVAGILAMGMSSVNIGGHKAANAALLAEDAAELGERSDQYERDIEDATSEMTPFTAAQQSNLDRVRALQSRIENTVKGRRTLNEKGQVINPEAQRLEGSRAVKKGKNRHDTATGVLAEGFEGEGYVNATGSDEAYDAATTGAEVRAPSTSAEALESEEAPEERVPDRTGEEELELEDERNQEEQEAEEWEEQERVRALEEEGARRAVQAYLDEQDAQLRAAQEAEKYAQLAHNAREFETEQEYLRKAQQARQAAEEAAKKAEEQQAMAASQSEALKGQEVNPQAAPAPQAPAQDTDDQVVMAQSQTTTLEGQDTSPVVAAQSANPATAPETGAGTQATVTQANTQGETGEAVKPSGNAQGAVSTPVATVEQGRASIESGETNNKTVAQVIPMVDKYVSTGNVISHVPENPFKANGKQAALPLSKKVIQWMKNRFPTGVRANSLGGTPVVISERGIKNDVAHGVGEAKAATFAAVPDVIRDGVVVSRSDGSVKGVSVTIAGRVDLAGTPVNVYCVLKQADDGSKRFYLHEVSDGNGTVYYQLGNNKNATPALQDSSRTNPASADVTSTTSIAQNPQAGNSTNPSTNVQADGTIKAQTSERSNVNEKEQPARDSSVHGRGREENASAVDAEGHGGNGGVVSRAPRISGEHAEESRQKWVNYAEAIEKAGGRILDRNNLPPVLKAASDVYEKIFGRPITYYDASGIGDLAQVGGVIKNTPEAGAFVAINHTRLRRVNGGIANGPGTAGFHEGTHIRWDERGKDVSKKRTVLDAFTQVGVPVQEAYDMYAYILNIYGYKYSAMRGMQTQLGVNSNEEWQKLTYREQRAAFAKISNDVRAEISEDMYEDLGNYLATNDVRFANYSSFKAAGKAIRSAMVNKGIYAQEEIDQLIKFAEEQDRIAIEEAERRATEQAEFDQLKENTKPISEFDPSEGTMLYEVPYISEDRVRKKELIAIHNCSISSARHILADGGKAMPSIAISKSTREHDDFGEVSFVFLADSIDPSKDPHNKVYGGDAYTPVYNKYLPNTKTIVGDVNGFAEEVSQLARELVPELEADSGEFMPGAYRRVEYGEEDTLQDFLDGAYRSQFPIKAAILAERGYDLELLEAEAEQTPLDADDPEIYAFGIDPLVEALVSDSEVKSWLTKKFEKYGITETSDYLERQLNEMRRHAPRKRPFLYDFRSLDELRSHKDLLSGSHEHAVGSDQAYREAQDLREYAWDAIIDDTDLDGDEAQDALETIAEHQRDFKKDEDYIEFFRNAYSQDGISTETIEAIKHALLANAELPTGYFEAKPDRILPLSEFKAALIPADQNQLAEECKAAGIKPFLYKTTHMNKGKTRVEIINEDLAEYLFEEPYLDEETQADQQQSQQIGRTPGRVKKSQDVNRTRTATKGETKAQFENNGETDYISRTNAQRSQTADLLTDTQEKADAQVQRLLKEDYTWTDDDVVIAQKVMFDMVKGIRDYQLHRDRKMSKEAFKIMTNQYNQLRDKHTRTLSEMGQTLQANYMFSTGDKIVMKTAQTFLGFTKDGRFAGGAVNAKNAKIYAGVEEAARRIQAAVDKGDAQSLVKICKDISDIRNVKKMFGPLSGFAGEVEDRVLARIAKGENAAQNLEALAYGNLNAVCDDVQPYKALNAAKTIRIMNMLSNYATIVNNLANNFMQGTVSRSTVGQAFTRMAAAPFENLTGQQVISKAKTGVGARKAIHNAKVEAFETSVLMQMYGIKEANGRLELDDRGMFNPNINPFEQTMSLYRFLTGVGVESTDRMQGAGFLKSMELGIDEDIKAGKIAPHTREQRMQEARHEVNKLLYKDDNAITAWVLHTREFLNKIHVGNERVGTIGLGDITMAFAKIPTNVIKFRLMMTPEGALFQVAQYAKGVNKAKRMHAEVLAKGIVEQNQEKINAWNDALQAAYEMEHGPAKDAAIRKAQSELSKLNAKMWAEAQEACRGSVYKNLETIRNNYNENLMFDEAAERAGYMDATEMSQFEAAQLSRKIGWAAMSVGMMALGSVLRALGALRDFDQEPNDELRKMNADKGYKGLMLNLSAMFRKDHEWKDGEDITLSGEFLEVIALPLTIGATAAEAAVTAQDAKTWRWFKSMAGNGIAKTFEAVGDIPGMADAINMYESMTSAYNNDYDEKVSRLGAGLLQYAANTAPTFFMPNAVTQAVAGIDNKVRDPYAADTPWGQAKNIFMNKFPVLRNKVPVSVDVWGNERTYGEGPWGAINKMLLPGDVLVYRKNKYEKEIERLVREGYGNATPKTTVNSSFEVGDEKYTMTAQEKLDFKAARNSRQRELFETFIDSEYYKQLNDAERTKVFQALKTSAERDAKQDMLNDRQLNVDITRDKWETELLDVNDQIQFLAAKQIAGRVWDTDENSVSDYAAMDDFLTNEYNSLSKTQQEILGNSFSHLDDLAEAKKVGINSENWQASYNIYQHYTRKDEEGHQIEKSDLATASAMWAQIQEATGFSDSGREMKYLQENMKMTYVGSINTESYDELIYDYNMSRESAAKVYSAFSTLKPTEGYAEVQARQKWKALPSSGLSDSEQWDTFFALVSSNSTNQIRNMTNLRGKMNPATLKPYTFAEAIHKLGLDTIYWKETLPNGKEKKHEIK